MDVGSAVGRPRRSERGDGWRAFGTAARLGWQMEANWTDPVLFAIYSVAKPVLGRGVARVGVGLIGAVIALGVGFVFLGVGFDPARVDPILSGVSMVVGLGAVVAIGILMAAVCLQTRQDSWRYPEALAGALFLISGVVFPLSVLPDPVQAVGLVSPLSWWIEGVRRGLLPDSPTGIGGSGSLFERLVHADRPDPVTIVAALLVTGVVVTLAATLAFRVSERRAKDRGLIDQTTGY
ncbi:MAG: ABC transporter permease [Chloroflexi bacterium]|nr:ABC transporter permease [Chloroflexota bacterium]